MEPVLSVQIPVKNGGEEFRRCLGSLADQDTGGEPWELILVDDGSDVPVEEEFAGDLPGKAAVRVIRLEGPGNRPSARNAAWNATGAGLSLLSDGDILFPPGVLRHHLEMHAVEKPDVLMGARVNAWRDDATPWQRWFDSRAMGSSPRGVFPGRYFITGNLSIRTDILRETGGFDPAIDRYGGEDTEFGLRLQSMDCTMLWEPTLRVLHLDTVTVRQHSRKMLEYGSSGLRYTLEKHESAEGLLGSRWVQPILASPAGAGTVSMRLLCRIVLLPPVYRLVLRWMERFGRPGFLFTYLSVGACLLGLKGADLDL
jgi:glycosyltransferase involved in cell wall biosynthesis